MVPLKEDQVYVALKFVYMPGAPSMAAAVHQGSKDPCVYNGCTDMPSEIYTSPFDAHPLQEIG